MGANYLRTKNKCIYFEINEDFNLNLKTGATLSEEIKASIWNNLEEAEWPSYVKHHDRDYQQTAHVFYELDFGFLKEIIDIPKVVRNLATSLEVAVKTLRQS